MTTEQFSNATPQPYGADPSAYGQPPAYGQPAAYAQPQPAYAQPQTVYVQNAPSNGLGTAGFVTGLLGLLFCWVAGLGIVLALLGVILGGVGISAGKKKGAPTGLAVAGLVLGIIALIPAILIISAVASIGASL